MLADMSSVSVLRAIHYTVRHTEYPSEPLSPTSSSLCDLAYKSPITGNGTEVRACGLDSCQPLTFRLRQLAHVQLRYVRPVASELWGLGRRAAVVRQPTMAFVDLGLQRRVTQQTDKLHKPRFALAISIGGAPREGTGEAARTGRSNDCSARPSTVA